LSILLETDRHLQALLQAFPDPLFVLDGDGTILEYKPGETGLLYMLKAPLGRRIQECCPLQENYDARRVLQASRPFG
jgi:hypothetical protein